MRRRQTLPAFLALALAAASCGREKAAPEPAGTREQALGAAGAPCSTAACTTASECPARNCGVAACVSNCCVYTARNCADTNPCTADSCNDTTGCVNANLTGPACEIDGNKCTPGTCTNGACVEGPAKVCPGESDCKRESACDPASGNCSVQQNKPADVACDLDQDTCTLDHCDGTGSCAAGDYSATAEEACGLDPAGSTLTASTAKLPTGGYATLTAHPVNRRGQPFPKPVTVACSFGTVGAPTPAGGDTLATLTSPFPGVSTCGAASEGQSFDATVAIAFTGVGVTLAHAATRPNIEEGEGADLVATLASGATANTPGVTLEVVLPEGLRYVEGSARVQGATVTASQNARKLQLRLPDLPAAPEETRVGYRLVAEDASSGIKPVVARALVGDVPASADATAELTVGAIYELGGCGCAQGAGAGAESLGIALWMGLAAWFGRGRRPTAQGEGK